MSIERKSKVEIGLAQEKWVKQKLKILGFTQIEHNIRTPFAQIDLIAQSPREKILYLIEVKTLRSERQLEFAIQSHQKLRLQRAANYLSQLRSTRVELLLCAVVKSGKEQPEKVHWLPLY